VNDAVAASRPGVVKRPAGARASGDQASNAAANPAASPGRIGQRPGRRPGGGSAIQISRNRL